MTRERRPVTIVVPIYDDLPGLERCIEALLETVDFSIDRVLLANDVGPHVDTIEARVLELVGDRDGFEYTRNAANLGFVGNCNRAVLDLDRTGNDVLLLNSDTVPMPGFLDEMTDVLASDDSIGVVCARSDNATIASFPYARRNPRATLSPRRTRELHGRTKYLLPRSTVSPVAMGFCFLIRREVIDRYGLFDEVFSPGYGEENDFCLRINEHGFTSVLANRALVLHTGSTSFSGDRGPSLRLEHERILLERYPFYAGAVALFLARYRDAVDVFADAFLPDDDVVRVALHLPAELSDDVTARVRSVLAAAPEDVVVTVIVAKAQIRVARQAFPGALIAAGGRPRQIFDVAVALGALTTFAQLSTLNANAPRWILVDPVSHDIRWSHAVANHRASAIDRILRRFENQSTSWRGGDELIGLIRMAAGTEIDPAALRARWHAVSDIAEATGLLVHRATVSFRRLTALSFGARNPRIVARIRAITGRGA
ncbi:glycosyltransferase family 2 protein [Curtobacterium sp. PhB115]|uniref:glycosyltransferase family 2 protein n=1 Tax=Curtobacterium sp. PhB115 TaxID=2485173 RepID=UPI000F4BC266|nr:glycosyltransferase family 2 protein [Curtobacterium sp. PhB115]ROP64000.1 GT2 family glycosyltransferase [Curtobacterium sp. PhB115]